MIYPGYKIMVDATVADFYLVGRPTIYLAVDVFSRMLVGLHISMQPESWEGYAILLHNTFCPKPEYCSRFDISINDEDWPFHHIPVEIIADNSSMRSVDTQVLASEFQIRVEYTKGFTAKLKAVVEHYHSTIKELIRSQMPGLVNKKNPTDNDWKANAAVSFPVLRKICIHEALLQNRYWPVKGISVSLDLGLLEKGCTPISLWNQGMETHGGRLREMNSYVIKKSVAPKYIGTRPGKRDRS